MIFARVATTVPSVFNPKDYSPKLWLDASDSTTITAAGGTVSQWNDKSGNGFNFTQGTAANQPGTGTQTKNGLNVLTFDGSTDVMQTTGWTAEWKTVFAVSYVDTTAIFKTIAGAESDNTYGVDAYYLQYGTTTRTPTFARGLQQAGDTTVSATRTAVANQTWAIFEGTFDNASTKTITLAINGGTAGSSTSNVGLRPITGNVAIGAGYFAGAIVDYLPGRIAEIIIYDSILTTDQRTEVRNYLNTKWAIY